jgi:hypothetical protein
MPGDKKSIKLVVDPVLVVTFADAEYVLAPVKEIVGVVVYPLPTLLMFTALIAPLEYK